MLPQQGGPRASRVIRRRPTKACRECSQPRTGSGGGMTLCLEVQGDVSGIVLDVGNYWSADSLLTRQARKPARNRDSTVRDSTSAARSSKLFITAFVVIMCPLARTNDHAEAALTHRDTPDKPAKTPDQEPQRLNNKLSRYYAMITAIYCFHDYTAAWPRRIVGRRALWMG